MLPAEQTESPSDLSSGCWVISLTVFINHSLELISDLYFSVFLLLNVWQHTSCHSNPISAAWKGSCTENLEVEMKASKIEKILSVIVFLSHSLILLFIDVISNFQFYLYSSIFLLWLSVLLLTLIISLCYCYFSLFSRIFLLLS